MANLEVNNVSEVYFPYGVCWAFCSYQTWQSLGSAGDIPDKASDQTQICVVG